MNIYEIFGKDYSALYAVGEQNAQEFCKAVKVARGINYSTRAVEWPWWRRAGDGTFQYVHGEYREWGIDEDAESVQVTMVFKRRRHPWKGPQMRDRKMAEVRAKRKERHPPHRENEEEEAAVGYRKQAIQLHVYGASVRLISKRLGITRSAVRIHLKELL